MTAIRVALFALAALLSIWRIVAAVRTSRVRVGGNEYPRSIRPASYWFILVCYATMIAAASIYATTYLSGL